MGTFVRKNRVRDGGKKIQRRKKVSAKKGFTLRGGDSKLKRIPAAERLNRKKKAKISAFKRRSKKTVARLKQKKSLKKRKVLGFDK